MTLIRLLSCPTTAVSTKVMIITVIIFVFKLKNSFVKAMLQKKLDALNYNLTT